MGYAGEATADWHTTGGGLALRRISARPTQAVALSDERARPSSRSRPKSTRPRTIDHGHETWAGSATPRGLSVPAGLSTYDPPMATARLGSIALDCDAPAALAEFWATMLGGEVAFSDERARPSSRSRPKSTRPRTIVRGPGPSAVGSELRATGGGNQETADHVR